MLQPYIELPRQVHLLCLGTLIQRAGTFVLPFLSLYLTQKLGYSYQVATGAIAMLGLGTVAGALVGGHLADHVGRRRIALLALVGGAAILSSLQLLTSPVAVYAGVFALTAVADMYRPASQALIADLTTPAQRPYAYGLVYLAINLGFPIGAFVAGIVSKHSWSWLFYGNALASLSFAALIALGIRETKPRDTHASENSGGANAESRPGVLAALGHIGGDRPFLLLCAANVLIGVVYLQSMSTLPLYLTQLGIGGDAYGRIIGVNGLLIVIGQIFVTRAVAHREPCRMLALAALIVGTGFGLHIFARAEWHFELAVVVWTLGEMLQAPLVSPLVARIAPPALRARYMGVMGLSFSGANAIGAPLGGYILTHAGGVVLWAATVLVAWSAAILYALLRSVMRTQQDPGAPAHT